MFFLHSKLSRRQPYIVDLALQNKGSFVFRLQKAYTLTIGTRHAEQAGMLGTLFLPEQAHQIGLVDQLSEADKLLDDTHIEMAKWLRTSGKYSLLG